jgi:hypothetical protein
MIVQPGAARSPPPLQVMQERDQSQQRRERQEQGPEQAATRWQRATKAGNPWERRPASGAVLVAVDLRHRLMFSSAGEGEQMPMARRRYSRHHLGAIHLR